MKCWVCEGGVCSGKQMAYKQNVLASDLVLQSNTSHVKNNALQKEGNSNIKMTEGVLLNLFFWKGHSYAFVIHLSLYLYISWTEFDIKIHVTVTFIRISIKANDWSLSNLLNKAFFDKVIINNCFSMMFLIYPGASTKRYFDGN